MLGLQIRCGDLYSDKAISTFNECAVSNKKCVPQRIDEDVYPVPKTEVLDHNFDLSKFEVGLICRCCLCTTTNHTSQLVLIMAFAGTVVHHSWPESPI